MVVKTPEAGNVITESGEVPPLRDGERMNAEEFFRRYSAMPDVKKAELIDGVVYMPSPVSLARHGRPDHILAHWIGCYTFETPLTESAGNTMALLGDRHQPQPDIMLRRMVGGTSIETEDGYLEGPPELVAEIAASSLDRDLGPRFAMYREVGVSEYLVWAVEENVIHWWRLRDGGYEALPPDAMGVIRSEVFPGLWLDSQALLANDRAGLLRTLQAGLASPEHADFVRELVSTSAREGV